jgi:subfamily B ATP-binding cassette protein MsbA
MITISPYLKRLGRMVLPYKGRLGLGFLGMVLTAATEPLFPAVLQDVIDNGFAKKPDFHIWMVPVMVIGIFVLRGLSTYLTNYMMTWVSTRLLVDLRRQAFARVLQVPMGFYSDNALGRVINSMMFEVQQIVEMITKVITSIIRDTVTFFGLLGYLFYLNWRLTFVALILLPLTAGVIRLTATRLRRLTRGLLDVNAGMTQVLEETTRAHQVIKIFGGQDFERKRFEERIGKLRGLTMRLTTTFAATVPVTQVMASCAVATVMVIALIQASHGQTSVGEFVSFMTSMLMLLTPLKHLAEVNGPLQRGLAAAEAVFSLIDTEPERSTGKTLAGRAQGHLQFKDVSFTYPGQNQPALEHIDLDIAPGETIAFVGMSGGGKSTLVNLVPGFSSVQQGRIELDGEAIDDLSLLSLRAQMAMVSQHVVLFDDTVAANIAYGDPAPDPARIAAAAKAAHLDGVIELLPEGLQTTIGDNGSRLSGGQRQRLAIARAIYKDAPILILDEATSALDTESERAVQAALDGLMQGRTTLVIAHRLSTIERASRIVVLVHGRIVEIGTHAELLARGDVYANLYHLQFETEQEPV